MTLLLTGSGRRRHARGMSKLLVLLSLALVVAACTHRSVKSTALSYPQTRKDEVTDNYHGTPVADPYRWLEDDNSAETKGWVEAQNRVTFAYLDAIPERTAISNRLTQLWNYERWGTPSREGARYFVSRNNGLQNQSVLYTMTSLDGELRELLDPNRLSTDGTVALGGAEVSDDGNLLAYGLAGSGSDWQDWKVRDIRTGQNLPDDIRWVKFSNASWTRDGKGFYYSRYDEPKEGDTLKGANYFHKLYFHRLGSAQSEDVLVYHRPDHKEWLLNGGVTDDGR